MVKYWTVYEDLDRAEQDRETVIAICFSKPTIRKWIIHSLKKDRVILITQNFLGENSIIEVKLENLYRGQNGYWFNEYTEIA